MMAPPSVADASARQVTTTASWPRRQPRAGHAVAARDSADQPRHRALFGTGQPSGPDGEGQAEGQAR